MIRNLSLLSCWATFLFLLGIGIVGFTSAGSPLLIYKYTKSFQKNYDEINMWEPINTDKNLFPLGDLATNSNYPTETAMMVLDNKDGLVAPPTSMTVIWKGGPYMVLSLNAPAGYTCIGNLLIYTYDSNYRPGKNKYRCLRSDLVTPGKSTFIFQIGGKVSLWNASPDPSRSGAGLATGTFVYSNSPTAQPSHTFVVKSEMATQQTDPPRLVYNYMRLFEKSHIGMSGIWTPIDQNKNYFPLGDITNTTGTYFTDTNALMVLDNKDGSVAPPTSLTEIARNEEIVIFSMNAPQDYICIGHVAIKPSTAGTKPDTNNYRCLRYDLVTFANSTRFWNTTQFSLWNVIPDPDKPGGLETGTFLYSNKASQSPKTPSVALSNLANYVHVPPPVLLVYKYTESFKFNGLNLFTPIDKNQGYFPLGDLVSSIYPTETAMMVLDNGDGLVAPPASITEIWRLEMGFYYAIFSLDPPAGYTCIGNAGIFSFDRNFKLDKNKYRCLRSDLVISGDSRFFVAEGAISFWNVIPNPSKSGAGLATGTFVLSKSSTAKPSSTFVVDSKFTFEEYNPRPSVVYKQAKAYTILLKVKEEMTIWRPIDFFNRGYYALGDVYSAGNNYPANANAMMVQDNGDGLVAPPVSLTQWIGNADLGGSFYILNPLKGYTCMGMVAISKGVALDKDAYRCLRSDLVTQGQVLFKWPWNPNKISLWNIIRKDTATGLERALDTGGFVLFNSLNDYDKNWLPPVVLAHRATDVDPKYEDKNPQDIGLVLYETNILDLIWNDGGYYDQLQVSIWRTKECCSLGDVAVNGYYRLAAYMAKDVSPKNDALKKPNGFETIYLDRGRGGDIGIWKPTCPTDYVALGYVYAPNHHTPSVDTTNFRCVSTKLTTSGGKWTLMWNSKKSGVKKTFQIFKADPATIRGDSVGVWVMSVVPYEGYMSTQPTLLNAARVSLRSQKPIKSVRLINFAYDYANQVVVSRGPSEITKDLKRISVSNCPGNTEVTSGATVSYSITEEATFTWGFSLEVGVLYEAEAGIIFAKAKTTLSFKFSASVSRSTTKSETTSSSFEIKVPTKGGYTDSYYVTGTKYVASVPYTAEVFTTYSDDTTTTGTTSGIMANQQYSEIQFVREVPQYCGPPTTEAPTTMAAPSQSG